jgi:AraC family transcriptional regulator, regulatory protein of adaptative response / methylphosphotriester-DNA alkyltransferase methyltransferase
MDNVIFQSVYETILRRDTRYDGVYYVAISTTGIYCRPSCRSRTPRPETVKIYTSIDEAQRGGFRACKRCRPDNPGQHGPDAELAQIVTDLIQQRYHENLTLDGLAASLNISPYHLQRVYKRMTGITPSKQLLHTRLEAAKTSLVEHNQAIADISAAVGFRSASHFSYVFQKTVGCTPNEYRASSGNELFSKERGTYGQKDD